MSLAEFAGQERLGIAGNAALLASSLQGNPTNRELLLGAGLGVFPNKQELRPFLLVAKERVEFPGGVYELQQIAIALEAATSVLGAQPDWLRKAWALVLPSPQPHVSPGSSISVPNIGTVGCQTSWSGGNGFLTAGQWKNYDKDNGGKPRDLSGFKVSFPGPQITRSSPIKSVTITLIQHNPVGKSADNWDTTSLTVNAYTGKSQHVCQIKLSGNSKLDDKSIGLFRFKKNFDPDCSTGLCGPSHTFSGGCP